MPGQTQIEIRGSNFWINGAPTYAGRTWAGHRIEGLLLNARMVQATFDDLNPDTRDRRVLFRVLSASEQQARGGHGCQAETEPAGNEQLIQQQDRARG